MSADTMLDKLNRLRAHAGKDPLKSWKASKDKLMDAISNLENEGFTDVLPGANLDAAPATDDPEIIEAIKKAEEAEEEDDTGDEEAEKPVTKVKSSLARGVPSDSWSKNSRESLAAERRKEAKDKKAQRKADKKTKAEPVEKTPTKKKIDKAKAERQKKHIEEKRKASGRDKKPAKETNPNEITVAEVARELGMSPKIARAKLRRHEAKINDLHTKGQDRWTFPKSAKKTLTDILNGKK